MIRFLKDKRPRFESARASVSSNTELANYSAAIASGSGEVAENRFAGRARSSRRFFGA